MKKYGYFIDPTSWNDKCYMYEMWKYQDEWFEVDIQETISRSIEKKGEIKYKNYTQTKCYKCDQLSGLEELINDILYDYYNL
jgi:hypothetical protein